MPRALRQPACRLAVATALLVVALGACRGGGDRGPKHRERAAERDSGCSDPARPQAHFYPSEDRIYAPDDPWKDGCALLVPDHLFCCPKPAPPPAGR